jgi:hypothetical protein
MGKCYYSTVTFKSGNSINHQYALSFPYEAKSKVFLICVYDGYSYEQEVVAVKNGRDLKYELTVPKKLFGFIGIAKVVSFVAPHEINEQTTMTKTPV